MSTSNLSTKDDQLADGQVVESDDQVVDDQLPDGWQYYNRLSQYYILSSNRFSICLISAVSNDKKFYSV